MKNRAFVVSLVASTALLSSPVLAAEKIQVSVGGFMEQWFGYVDQDRVSVGGGAPGTSDDGHFDQKSDSEIHFTGRMIADNGITFGFEVELEANTSDDQIDDSFAFVSGSFGRVEIGSRDGAPALMQYIAPDVGIGANSGDQTSWVANLTAGGTSSPFETTFLYLADDQSQKVTYFSPRFAGFQLGATYIPEYRQSDSSAVPGTGGVYQNGFQFGVNYVESFGDFEVALAAGYASPTIRTPVLASKTPRATASAPTSAMPASRSVAPMPIPTAATAPVATPPRRSTATATTSACPTPWAPRRSA